MVLFLLRHGTSPSLSEARVRSDAERPLAGVGRDEARRAGRYLAAKGGRPALALVSPLLRAQQTADEALRELSLAPPRRTYAPLENRVPGTDLYRRLVDDEPGAASVLLIGHQPQLGELAAFLTGAFLRLNPGGLIAVEAGDGRGSLLWSANPDEFAS